MQKISKRVAHRFLIRQAGGLELGRDPAAQLSKLTGLLNKLSDKDIAYGTYVFEYIAGMTGDPRIKKFAAKLGEVYARRFAEWLGYAFSQRVERGRGLDSGYEELARNLGDWLKYLPEIITGNFPWGFPIEPVMGSPDRLDLDALLNVMNRIRHMVKRDYERAFAGWLGAMYGKEASLKDIPVEYDTALGYTIPYSPEVYGKYDKELRDLGFKWQNYRRLWYTDALTPKILSKLPQLKRYTSGPPAQNLPEEEGVKLLEWYMEEWLPRNVNRITRTLNTYSAISDTALDIRFTVNIDDGIRVTITKAPSKNLNVDEAAAMLREEYEDEPGREPWVEAIDTYKKLKRVRGMAAIKLVDFANNLEHSNGSMIEHLPPGVRSWYPRFLDFKYTADILQMVGRIKNGDLRKLAEALLPVHDRTRRLRAPQRDHRTFKGLILEIMAQPGRWGKQEKYDDIKKQYPDLSEDLFQELRRRGIRVN